MKRVPVARMATTKPQGWLIRDRAQQQLNSYQVLLIIAPREMPFSGFFNAEHCLIKKIL